MARVGSGGWGRGKGIANLQCGEDEVDDNGEEKGCEGREERVRHRTWPDERLIKGLIVGLLVEV